jgi:competence protein ComEA
MPTSEDRRAAAVLVGLAAMGLLVRWVAGPGPAGEVGFRAPPAEPVQRARVAAEAARLARPLGPRERVDLDHAPAAELARLPGIGDGLASRIVSYRERHGPFGSLEALGRVSGVGAGTLKALRPHAKFGTRIPGPAGADPLPPASARPPPPGPARLPPRLIHVNSATAVQLESLPGVGPAIAARILKDRAAHGPYGRPEDLLRVPGIGPATLKGIKSRIAIP